MTTVTDTRNGRAATPPLWLKVAGAAIVGTAVTVLVVLPAEYGVDPTGFGALTGLDRLSRPAEVVVETQAVAPAEIATLSDVPFRTDTVQIRVGGLTENFGAVEYKVSLEQGQVMVYSWTVPEELVYEFHGHTLPTEAEPQMQVMDYIKGKGTEAHGTLVAPIDGIHGWYFANSSLEPVLVELHLAGYYRLEPGLLDMTR